MEKLFTLKVVIIIKLKKYHHGCFSVLKTKLVLRHLAEYIRQRILPNTKCLGLDLFKLYYILVFTVSGTHLEWNEI